MPGEQTYFKLDFVEAPAEEGDNWQSVERSPGKCAFCGRRPLPFASRFPVGDDRVLRADAGIWGHYDHALLQCSGILLAREDVASALGTSQLTGFELREATVSRLDDQVQEEPLPTYRWVVITGRCETTPIWEQAVGVCNACHVPLMKPIDRTRRTWALQTTYPPNVDICRAREAVAGVIVSARFRDFVLHHDPRAADAIWFKPITFAKQAEAGSDFGEVRPSND